MSGTTKESISGSGELLSGKVAIYWVFREARTRWAVTWFLHEAVDQRLGGWEETIGKTMSR